MPVPFLKMRILPPVFPSSLMLPIVSGRYPYQATVFSNYLNSSIGGIASGNVIVLNRKNSPFGAGWAITGMEQLHPQADGTLLLTRRRNGAIFLRRAGHIYLTAARLFHFDQASRWYLHADV